MEFTAAGPLDRRIEENRGYLICIKKDEVLIDTPDFPRPSEKDPWGDIPGIREDPPSLLVEASPELFPKAEKLFIGYFSDKPVRVADIPPDQPESETSGHSWYPGRRVLPHLTETESAAFMRANHLRLWAKTSLYCGRCGGKNRFHERETARRCPACGLVTYPRISPAVITRIIKDDKILLAHNRNFPGDIHSLIAGFTDAGERLEETVSREIREEVGLEVKNIRYFGSQSWPFPNSLMCGFTAEWSSGEICPDQEEIEKADWFSRDKMPPIPGHGSISRVLIDDFLNS